MSVKRTIQELCAISLLSGCLFSQSTTGTLLGTVTDPGDAAVAGARVELRHAATGAVIATTTGAEGIFRFNSLVPATYNLTIRAAAGFKTYLQSDIDVTANEVRDLGKLSLTLGAISEQVTITASTSSIQTASAENSKLIDSAQLNKITLKGRDLFGLMVTMAGVSVTQRDTTSENTIGAVRHQRRDQFQYQLYGGWNHQPGHRLERDVALRAEHGFDRRDAGADQQLSGGVRPQCEWRNQRGDQGRKPGVPWQRLGQ